MRCQWRDCKGEVDVFFVIGGRRYGFCKRHARLVYKKLIALALERGEARLEFLEVKTRGDRVTVVQVKKPEEIALEILAGEGS